MALILSRAAQKDLADIALYTITTWGMDQADAYIGGMIAAMNLLSKDMPASRRDADLPDGITRTRHRSHHLYHRRIGDDLIIIRILHGRMDPARHLAGHLD